jgi:hypothetical protein
VFLATVLAAPRAFADGIDLVPYLARIGHGHSTAGVIGLVILWMLVNYALNFVVIGLPAVKIGPAAIRTVASGMVLLTLLGQVADRLGAMLAVMAMVPLDLEFGGLVFSWLLLGLNFLFFRGRRRRSGALLLAATLAHTGAPSIDDCRDCGSPDEPGVGDISDAVPRRAMGREFCCLFDNTFRSLTASPSHCRS